MATDYSDAVEAINSMAKVKMTMNRHKGEIHEMTPVQIIHLLKEEVHELEEALNSSDNDLMHIIEEAADAQNFLIAIVHQQIEKYRSRK